MTLIILSISTAIIGWILWDKVEDMKWDAFLLGYTAGASDGYEDGYDQGYSDGWDNCDGAGEKYDE
jgi:hypothetical protein